MRVLFLGSGAFGLPTLQSLAQGGRHDIVGVVSQPDRPAGRGGELTPTPIAAWAGQNLGGPLIRAEDVNVEPVLGRLRALEADLWLVIAFGQKLSVALLEGKTAINLHASLLPRWRGAAPINAAILGGDPETGNSVITLAQRMDAGLVLGRTRRAIDPALTAGELHDLLAADGPALVEQTLSEIGTAGVRGEAQIESLVTKARKLSRADSWVDFGESAEACRRRVHGLTPWPGVSVRIQDKDLKLLRVAADPESGGSGPAGTLVDASTGRVACKDGSILRMLEVQPAGGKAMRWIDFARGRRPALADGEIIIGKPAAPPTSAGRPTC